MRSFFIATKFISTKKNLQLLFRGVVLHLLDRLQELHMSLDSHQLFKFWPTNLFMLGWAGIKFDCPLPPATMLRKWGNIFLTVSCTRMGNNQFLWWNFTLFSKRHQRGHLLTFVPKHNLFEAIHEVDEFQPFPPLPQEKSDHGEGCLLTYCPMLSSIDLATHYRFLIRT